MWLASYGGGLNKYSPLTSLFRHSLTTNNSESFRVESFAETSDETIWLSTEKQGLFKVNRNKVVENIQTQLKENIRHVLADERDNLWFYTENNKLFNFIIKSKELIEHKKWQEKAKHSNSKQIEIIGSDLWYINNNNNLTLYNTATQSFVNYVAPGKVIIKKIQKDLKGDLWMISSKNQLIKFIKKKYQ